jgi:hypothetical protein
MSGEPMDCMMAFEVSCRQPPCCSLIRELCKEFKNPRGSILDVDGHHPHPGPLPQGEGT